MPRTAAARLGVKDAMIPAGDFVPFRARSYQRAILQAFSIDPATGLPRTRHGVWVAHRRAGKDTTGFGILLPAMGARPGNYFAVYPTFSQGKRIVWQESSFTGMFPPHWSPRFMETELYVELTIPGKAGPKRGRVLIVGADDQVTVSRLVGTNPLGVFYSEASLMDEAVHQLLRPALRENRGWELFAFTPRGKNWAHKLYLMARGNPEWFCELLTVEQTRRDGPGEDGGPVISLEDVERDRREGMPEEIIQQEYYCSFEGYAHGTIYGDCLVKARAEGRVKACPWDPARPVGVMADIGRSDLLAVLFYQVAGSEIRIVDYHAERGATTGSFVIMLSRKPYTYARVVLPWDASHEYFVAPESVEAKARKALRCRVVVADKMPVHVGIDRVREKFPRFVFDEVKCATPPAGDIPSLLDSLGNYKRRWDAEKSEYAPEPVHDQFSHGADALRTGMQAWQEGLEDAEDRPRVERAVTEFQVFQRPERGQRGQVERDYAVLEGVR